MAVIFIYSSREVCLLTISQPLPEKKYCKVDFQAKGITHRHARLLLSATVSNSPMSPNPIGTNPSSLLPLGLRYAVRPGQDDEDLWGKSSLLPLPRRS